MLHLGIIACVQRNLKREKWIFMFTSFNCNKLCMCVGVALPLPNQGPCISHRTQKNWLNKEWYGTNHYTTATKSINSGSLTKRQANTCWGWRRWRPWRCQSWHGCPAAPRSQWLTWLRLSARLPGIRYQLRPWGSGSSSPVAIARRQQHTNNCIRWSMKTNNTIL